MAQEGWECRGMAGRLPLMGAPPRVHLPCHLALAAMVHPLLPCLTIPVLLCLLAPTTMQEEGEAMRRQLMGGIWRIRGQGTEAAVEDMAGTLARATVAAMQAIPTLIPIPTATSTSSRVGMVGTDTGAGAVEVATARHMVAGDRAMAVVVDMMATAAVVTVAMAATVVTVAAMVGMVVWAEIGIGAEEEGEGIGIAPPCRLECCHCLTCAGSSQSPSGNCCAPSLCAATAPSLAALTMAC